MAIPVRHVLQPIEQQPEDLVLAVLRRPAPFNLRVLREQVISLGQGMQAVASVVGESHTLRLERGGDVILLEILACVSVPRDACQHYHPLRDLGAHDYAHDAYRTQVTFPGEPSSVPVGWNCLSVTFPTVNGIRPVTRVCWQAQAQAFAWRTLHVYPRAGRCVYVETSSHYSLWR